MRILILVALSLIFGAVSYAPPKVLAGGCCYLDYAVTPGTADKQPATIRTAFTDPANPYSDDTFTKLKPITNQKVSIRIQNGSSGQTCSMTSDTTNAEGYVSASCTSNTPGEISVVFSLVDNPNGINDILNTVPLKVVFDGTAEFNPVVVPASPSPEPTPIVIAQDQEENMAELEDKIIRLEAEVEEQKQEVFVLRAKVNSLFEAISKFFHFGQ